MFIQHVKYVFCILNFVAILFIISVSRWTIHLTYQTEWIVSHFAFSLMLMVDIVT